MAPIIRRAAFPKVVIERDSDSEQSSSDEEPDEEEDSETLEDGEEVVEKEKGIAERGDVERVEVGLDAKRKGKAPISISLKKVCKVCKRPGHEAGFKGATFIDCPMKPCYLCKLPGHTTMTCPHKVNTEFGVIPAPRRNTRKPLEYVFERQLRPSIPRIKTKYIIPDQVQSAVIRHHSRRVTCLEFHPTKNNILLSGDKMEPLVILTWRLEFHPHYLNPDGWQGPNSWKMLYGMDVNLEKGLVLAADNFGFLYMVDTRTNQSKAGNAILIHKKGTKVAGLHCNLVHPDLLLSCGNDHFARIWDMRRLETGSSLYGLAHGRVVTSAYFSPISGIKVLTTSLDNRLRIWDSIVGNMDSPSRQIVHSHDFNRYLTPFRAEWDPKDPSESLVVVGRYISENYNGAALHPIDFIDTSTRQLVAEVMDPNITTISPVNKLHPRDDILASGSSRSLFIWKPKEKCEPIEEKKESKIVICANVESKKGKKKGRKKCDDDNDDSDDDAFISKLKKSKSKSQKPKK